MNINSIIDQLKEIENLKDNWDDEGAEIIQKSILNRAIILLKKPVFEDNLDVQISPCGNGSLDLHWKNAYFECLLNLPSNNGLAGYYVNLKERGDSRGKINLETADKFFEWIFENQLKLKSLKHINCDCIDCLPWTY